jgi:hypothetical protein
MPAKISAAIRKRAARVKLLLCGVDAMLTDGSLCLGLKARNNEAQGDALGLSAQIISSPDRAQQKWVKCFVVPLQGTSFWGFVSQGVALGCLLTALSARKTRASKLTLNLDAITEYCF